MVIQNPSLDLLFMYEYVNVFLCVDGKWLIAAFTGLKQLRAFNTKRSISISKLETHNLLPI